MNVSFAACGFTVNTDTKINTKYIKTALAKWLIRWLRKGIQINSNHSLE